MIQKFFNDEIISRIENGYTVQILYVLIIDTSENKYEILGEIPFKWRLKMWHTTELSIELFHDSFEALPYLNNVLLDLIMYQYTGVSIECVKTILKKYGFIETDISEKT